MTFPMKNSVLDNFPPCPPAHPLKSANFIFIVVSLSLTQKKKTEFSFQLSSARVRPPKQWFHAETLRGPGPGRLSRCRTSCHPHFLGVWTLDIPEFAMVPRGGGQQKEFVGHLF